MTSTPIVGLDSIFSNKWSNYNLPKRLFLTSITLSPLILIFWSLTFLLLKQSNHRFIPVFMEISFLHYALPSQIQNRKIL